MQPTFARTDRALVLPLATVSTTADERRPMFNRVLTATARPPKTYARGVRRRHGAADGREPWFRLGPAARLQEARSRKSVNQILHSGNIIDDFRRHLRSTLTDGVVKIMSDGARVFLDNNDSRLAEIFNSAPAVYLATIHTVLWLVDD